jgi:hypothetical protein
MITNDHPTLSGIFQKTNLHFKQLIRLQTAITYFYPIIEQPACNITFLEEVN